MSDNCSPQRANKISGLFAIKTPQLRLEFAEPTKLPHGHPILDHKRVEGQRARALLSRDEGLLRQRRGLGEPSVHQRAHSLQQEAALETVLQLRLGDQIVP